MSANQLELQIITVSENIMSLDFESINSAAPQVAPWNTLTLEDFFTSVEDLKKNLEYIKEASVLHTIPWNILNSLHGQLNNTFTHCKNFITSANQQNFHQAMQHVEACRTNMQTWGINRIYFSNVEFESKSQLLNDEIQKFLAHNREIETIKQNVNKLIEPAVAGSLSKSFENRKADLNRNQVRWFWASASMALISLITTYCVVSSIIGVFEDKEVVELFKNPTNGSGILWTSVFLRIGILLPVYSLFAFAFSQYKKERDLEEIYAHKAAVATSLPNYGDLAVDNGVKDQILSEASKVIFTIPSLNASKIANKQDGSTGVDQVNELIGSITKLIPKAKD